MKINFQKLDLVISCFLFFTTPVFAHWLSGMDYKIHHPQEPNANGWNVCICNEVADDFMCTETGPIGDIYFWISSKADANAIINQWTISIAADDSGTPGNTLWTWDRIGVVKIMQYSLGAQGWYCPNTSLTFPNDHTKITQVHIGAIKNTFAQQQGQLYWLVIRAAVKDPNKPVGWSTSTTNFFSSALWKNPATGWQPLEQVGNPDLALVIQGECYAGRPDYSQWIDAGKNECWCYPRQCHGDADGYKNLLGKTGYYYVGAADLNILQSAWQVKNSPKGPGVSGNQGCADFTRTKHGDYKNGYYRVGASDLNLLVYYWQVKESPFGPGVPPNCLPGSRTPPPAGGIHILYQP